jgi:hypothetical protein
LGSNASGTQQAAEYLAGRYRALQIADSLKGVVSRSRDTGAFRVFIDETYPAPLRALIDSMARRAHDLKAGNGSSGIDVFAVSDQVAAVRGVGRYPLSGIEVRYEMPAAPGQRRRVYMRTGTPRPGEIERTMRSQSAAEQLLGPCAFFAAFGEPGPRVRQWLTAGGWGYATAGSWTSTPVPSRWILDNDPNVFAGPRLVLWYFSVESGGPACIVGDLKACEAIAVAPHSRVRSRAIGDMTAGLQLGGNRYFPMGLGAFGGEFLSDLVRERGRERFKAFWTSADSVPAAYAAVTGKPWAQQIHEWMVSKYGVIKPGPRVTNFALMMSVVLVSIAIAVVFRFSLARRYA